MRSPLFNFSLLSLPHVFDLIEKRSNRVTYKIVYSILRNCQTGNFMKTNVLALTDMGNCMNSENKSWNNEVLIKNALDALQANKLVVGTTDTVLGLFAAATQEGFELLNKLKQREKKPYLLIASSPGSIVDLVNLEKSFHIEKIMESFWPGPLTIIFKAKEGVPDYFLSEQKTIAIRVPDHKGMRALLQQTGLLFSTSANKAGELIPVTVQELDPELAKDAEYIIDDEVPRKNAIPSTLIDCSKLTEASPVIRVIREGKITLQDLQEVVGNEIKITF